MKYALLLYQDKAFEAEWEAMGPDERAPVYAQFQAFTEAAEAAGAKVLGGNELSLSHTATTVRRTSGARTATAAGRDGEEFVITDGPFAEVTEHLGGYFEVEARDLDHILGVVRSLPAGTTEIRPIVEAAG